MCGNRDVIMTGITFLPPTTMRVFTVYDVDGATVRTFPLFSASLGPEMERQALRAVKREIALLADGGGLLEFVVVWAWIWLVSIAGPASSPLTGVVGRIIGVVTTVTLRAPIAFVDEACNGGASFIMGVTFEKDDLVFCVRATEYQKEGVLATEDLQLIRRVEGGEVCLELLQLWESTRTFRDACISVELTGSDGLAGSSVAKGVPVAAGHVMTVIAVTMGPHGHNGPGTTQFVFVMDGDDRFLTLAVLLHRSYTHIPLAGSTAGGGHPD